MKIVRCLKLFTNFSSNLGFTLIELMIIIAILGTLAGIAIPNYINYRERAKIAQCISDIKTIEKELFLFYIDNNTFPANLNAIGLGNLRDAWDRPYNYLPVAGTPQGLLRKDHFLVPVNTDFDLFSRGKDGISISPFTAKASRDDIVRANNGQFVGSVSDY
ncbi:MAG: type II secretion system protein GspG [Desulfobacteraceae bacterium]|nr:type II secretion system protein GspG [Desulfobacteraceae bacterium]